MVPKVAIRCQKGCFLEVEVGYPTHKTVKNTHKANACEKVLNSGLSPFKDQTAEMVLFWSFFLHKSPFFLEITTKSPQKLYKGVLFWSFLYSKVLPQ